MSRSVIEENRSSPGSPVGYESFVSGCSMPFQKIDTLRVLSLFGEGDKETHGSKFSTYSFSIESL